MKLKKALSIVILFPMLLINQVSAQNAYDFGDGKSATLTSKAWMSLELKDWNGLEAYTQKCITLYSKEAAKQQAELKDFAPANIAFNYWALNDVSTCYFILAKALKEQGKIDEAKKACSTIMENYSYGQCYEPGSKTFWKITEGSRDLLTGIEVGIDFEDYTSETLTRKTWEALGSGNLNHVLIYAQKCIALYSKEAAKQQASLTAYATKEQAFNYWALNDIGTCYFVMGEAYLKNSEWQNAYDSYKKIVDEYSFSQCWDSKGWFWKPGVAARGKLSKIIAEHGDEIKQ